MLAVSCFVNLICVSQEVSKISYSLRSYRSLLCSPQTSVEESKVTNWVVICREKGNLEIYSVPDFRLVFVCQNFSNAPKLLIDSGNLNSQNGRFVLH